MLVTLYGHPRTGGPNQTTPFGINSVYGFMGVWVERGLECNRQSETGKIPYGS